MKICLVQLQVGLVTDSIESRIAHIETLFFRHVVANETDDNVSLVLLPETAFSSYCQPDASHALQTAREQESKVKAWGSKTAVALNTYLSFGYIGLSGNGPRNALAVFSPSGQIIRDQSKRFLYDSDMKWTNEREPGFDCVDIAGFRVMFAICSDINAVDFSKEQMDSHPLATAAKDQHADVICLSAAWCSAHPDSPRWAHDEPVTVDAQIEYWLERMKPLLKTSKVYLCCADLVGREQIPGKPIGTRIRYCGSSCVLDLKEQAVVGGQVLDTESEDVVIVDVVF